MDSTRLIVSADDELREALRAVGTAAKDFYEKMEKAT